MKTKRNYILSYENCNQSFVFKLIGIFVISFCFQHFSQAHTDDYYGGHGGTIAASRANIYHNTHVPCENNQCASDAVMEQGENNECMSCFFPKKSTAQECPSGSTPVNQPQPLFITRIKAPTASKSEEVTRITLKNGATSNTYEIKWWCEEAKDLGNHHRAEGSWITSSIKYTNNSGGGVTGQNARMCALLIPAKALSSSFYTQIRINEESSSRDYVESETGSYDSQCRERGQLHDKPFKIWASCPPTDGDDKELICKTIIRNFIEGKETLKPGFHEGFSRQNNCCGGRFSIPGCNLGVTGGRWCEAKLYDRTTGGPTGKSLRVYSSKRGSLVDGLGHNAGIFPQMECISNGITYRNMCKCLSSEYIFSPGDAGASPCACPDGTARPANGICGCPEGTTVDSSDNNYCKCNNGSYRFRKDESNSEKRKCSCEDSSNTPRPADGVCLFCPAGTTVDADDNNYCKCNNGSYRFRKSETDSFKRDCACQPGSTAKPADGNCPGDQCNLSPRADGCCSGAIREDGEAQPGDCTCPEGSQRDDNGNCIKPCATTEGHTVERCEHDSKNSTTGWFYHAPQKVCRVVHKCQRYGEDDLCCTPDQQHSPVTPNRCTGTSTAYEDNRENFPDRTTRCPVGDGYTGKLCTGPSEQAPSIPSTGECICPYGDGWESKTRTEYTIVSSGGTGGGSDGGSYFTEPDIGNIEYTEREITVCQKSCTPSQDGERISRCVCEGGYSYEPGLSCTNTQARCKCPDGSPRQANGTCPPCPDYNEDIVAVNSSLDMNVCPSYCKLKCKKTGTEIPKKDFEDPIKKEDFIKKCCSPCGGGGLESSCTDGKKPDDYHRCPSIGDPNRADIVLGSSKLGSSFRSVYSLGRADLPDYVCWETTEDNKGNKIRKQRRDLYCPLISICPNGNCRCLDSNGNNMDNTQCHYAKKDPFKRMSVSGEKIEKPDSDNPGNNTTTKGHRLQIDLTRTIKVVPPQ